MRLSRRRQTVVATATTLLAASFALVAARPALAAPPPWEPDANALGTLTFFDATGARKTSGMLTDAPFATYVLASAAAPNAGHTKATLSGATPSSTTPTGAWSAFQLSASTTFPNASAPGALGSTADPVVTLSGTDPTLADFVTAQPNTDTTAGYPNVYQLRVKTSGPGLPAGSSYFDADIVVNTSAGTWTQVYPEPPVGTATTTVLTAAPATAVQDEPVTFTATVSPSAAPGAVQFKDGTTDLGAPVPVSGGVATKTVSFPTVSSHDITATFLPSTSDYAGSTSNTVSYAVAAAPPAWLPVLYGPHRVGMTESCLAALKYTTGITYAWQQNGAAIAGATASTYQPVEGYYHHTLTCTVTASGPGGTVSATSAGYLLGVGPALVPTTKPYLYHGTNRTTAPHGAYEYVNHGAWSPGAATYTYQWYLGSTKLTGATSYRIVPSSGWIGKYLYCVVTAKRSVAWTPGVYRTAGVKVT